MRCCQQTVGSGVVFARVAIPEMLKEGYNRRLAAGVVAAGGTLATLIPPSAILVIYAIIVEESVGQLLLAGFLPGIVSALIYGLIIVSIVSFKPEMGPKTRIYSFKEKMVSLPATVPIFSVIIIIFGGRKIPELMRGIGKGIKEFKSETKDDEENSDTKSQL